MGSTSSTTEPTGTPAEIAIIGGGAGGLAVLKAVLDSPQYKAGLWKPTIYEAREDIAGTWLPAPPEGDPPLTPLYDSLTTNLPHPCMAYTSFPFKPETPLYPVAALVLQYFRDYASHFALTPHIRLGIRIERANRDAGRWRLSLAGGETTHADLLVVANGHYTRPRYPDTPGIHEWVKAGRAMHSVYYRRPHALGRKLLVVGGGPSGRDIAQDMRTVADLVVHAGDEVPASKERIVGRGRVAAFEADGVVRFQDGTVERDIDYCILATGYEMWFPFLPEEVLSRSEPPPAPPLPTDLHNSTYHVFPLARHVFPLQERYPANSLAFIGLPIRVIPLPLMEAQARAVLAAFADPKLLEGEGEKVLARTARVRDPHKYHVFEGHEQFNYRDELYRLAARASTPVAGPGSIADGAAYTVADWEKELYDNKNVLRTLWVGIEQRGEAEQWLKGVGENGIDDWMAMTRKMLALAKKQNMKEEDVDGGMKQ
ncbi:hypothetical protein BD626DRAFT_568939 [Schizophyllum amplum]|uniref:FAD/NAD(P)-binding domain-containing protein n=1 Tax=Schizophyllum amplum TaxID=97359 RepID=A0A550CFG8_9AGAR|nr:hypothetical protein BD626DRAFT_568939 [Auriculariopsis ampla]